MSDHKELCEALRSLQIHRSKVLAAADVIEQQAFDLAGRDALIEQQAARIAELEAAGVMTAVMLTIDGREYGVHPNVASRIAKLESSVEFSQRRLEQLSKLQSTMREPERTIVCDILANGVLLNPPIPADRYTAKPDARIAELEAQVMDRYAADGERSI